MYICVLGAWIVPLFLRFFFKFLNCSDNVVFSPFIFLQIVTSTSVVIIFVFCQKSNLASTWFVILWTITVYLKKTFGRCYSFSTCFDVWFKFMVLSATSNNIPIISWRSVLLVEETGVLE